MALADQAAELIPRLRRWTTDSWLVPAAPAAAPPAAEAPGPGTSEAVPAADGDGGSGSAGGVRQAGTRAAVAADVVQRVADAGADAEGRPRRVVPRLADTVLADQLAVLVEDVLRTGDPAAAEVTAAELARLRTACGFR
jgi:hypothetical protein